MVCVFFMSIQVIFVSVGRTSPSTKKEMPGQDPKAEKAPATASNGNAGGMDCEGLQKVSLGEVPSFYSK